MTRGQGWRLLASEMEVAGLQGWLAGPHTRPTPALSPTSLGNTGSGLTPTLLTLGRTRPQPSQFQTPPQKLQGCYEGSTATLLSIARCVLCGPQLQPWLSLRQLRAPSCRLSRLGPDVWSLCSLQGPPGPFSSHQMQGKESMLTWERAHPHERGRIQRCPLPPHQLDKLPRA